MESLKSNINKNSPLNGLRILYLGSSVTFGSASQGISFAEYIAERNGTEYVKEAVSGTTLVEGKNSYVERLRALNKESEFDLFICQLSTNDATLKKPLGAPAISEDYDTDTVCGAMEYIISYVRDSFDCPIMFYTNSYYDSENYNKMVDALHDISKKHGIGVIDLYCDENFNNISKEQREAYMADVIHPTRKGYLEWWTPKFEECITDYLRSSGENI